MTTDKQINSPELYQRQKNYSQSNGPTIICDGLQNPDNLGSILRVADATGSRGIILLDSHLDIKNKKISKLARSTDRHVPVEQLTLQQFIEIRNQFNNLYALEITAQSKSLFETEIINCDAVMLGHESKGIRDETLALCDGAIHLPMYGINGSMNISHALAGFIYEWRRQEKKQASIN